MAGRLFGPPPSVIQEFESSWRQWLHLVYRKVYKRSFLLVLQMIDGIAVGNKPDIMTDGLIGIAPVTLAVDNKRNDKSFSQVMPINWIKGSDIEFGITFANTQTQAGVVVVDTELVFQRTKIGEDLSLPGTSVSLALSLPNNVAANTLHSVSIVITPLATTEPGDSFQFEVARLGDGVTDTCVGDVGYKEIAFKYQGYLNHE